MSMKIILKTFVISMVALTACSDPGGPKEVLTAGEGEKIMTESKSNILVVYYSRSGRTRQLAHWIRETAKADLIEIKTVTPYPSVYHKVVKQAKREIDAGVKPELKTKIDNVAQYDTIFIGTPNWWSTMVPPVATLLTSYDFTGKIVIPFITHGSGGEAGCVSDMRKFCPKTIFKAPLVLQDSEVPSAQKKTVEWTKNVLKTMKGL